MRSTRLIALLVLMVVVSISAAQVAPDVEDSAHFRTTNYDPILGKPEPNDQDGVTFRGPITITGRFRAVPDDEMCGGFCLSFLPDKVSDDRLPHHVTPNGSVIPIDEILVFEGDQMFKKMIGAREHAKFIAQKVSRYEVAGELTLRNFRIYGACDKTYYEGDAVRMRPQIQTAGLIAGFEQPGC